MQLLRTLWFGRGRGDRSVSPRAALLPAAHAFAAERDRWALWLPVCLGAGIGLYFFLPVEPTMWPGPACVAIAAIAAVAGRRSAALLLPAIILGVIAAGFSIAQIRTAQVAAPVLEKRIGPVMVDGRIVDLHRRGARYRLVLDRLRIGRLAEERTPERIRLTVRAVPDGLRPGDTVRVRAIIAPPPAPAAPGAYDFARSAYFKRLGGVGFSVGRTRVTEAADRGPASPGIVVARLRQRMTERILAALDPPAGAIAAALMTGERGSIPDDILVAMRESGLAHLLAISGLHIGLVAGLLFFFLRLLLAVIEPVALRYPIKKWAALGAMAGAFLYLLISGATVPTQRAYLMVSVVLIAVMIDRTALSMRLVAWAAALVMVVAPENVLSVSFQLSFAAVIALIASYETVSRPLGRWRSQGGRGRLVAVYGAGILLTAVVAGLATAPFAIYHFNRLALYGVAANAVAVPLTGFWIMPWAMAAFVLMPFGLEGVALAPMGWGIDLLIAIARTVSGWRGSSVLVPAMPTAALCVVALGGLWLCLWRTRWRWLGVPVIAASLVTVAFVRPPDILIDGSAKLMAVRTADGGLALSSRRAARFEGEIWLRRSAQRRSAAWAGPGLACDSLGCIYRAGGQTVALVHHRAALVEDCAIATVIVSRVPVRRWLCRKPVRIIDRFKLWRGGGHAIWLDADRVRVESVNERRGRRPWTAQKGRRRRDRAARR